MGKPRWRIPKQPHANRELKKPKGIKPTEARKSVQVDLRPDEEIALPTRDFIGDLQARYRGSAADLKEPIRSHIRSRFGKSPEGF